LKFIVDAMLPSESARLLRAAGHDVMTPSDLGAHNLPDDVLIEHAVQRGAVVVTENIADFAGAACTVLLVRRSWWPRQAPAARLATAVVAWATATPAPGAWTYWLDAKFR
jgi:uncharacterized protein with PIN domain